MAFSIFLSPIVIFAIMVAIVILCLVAYLIISRRPTKEVLLLRPRDKRGLVVPIAQETDLGLICKKTGGIMRRFLKAGCAWTFTIRGKVVTRFIGLEGTAYTAILKGKEIVNISLEEALRIVWDDDFYDKIPPERKEAVEKDKWGITIEVSPIVEEEEGLIPMSSDDLHDADDDVVLSKIAKGANPSAKREIYQFAMGAIAGGFLVYLSVMQGWL